MKQTTRNNDTEGRNPHTVQRTASAMEREHHYDIPTLNLAAIAARGKAKALTLMRPGLLQAIGEQNRVVMEFQQFRRFMPVAFPFCPCTPDVLQEAAQAEHLTVVVSGESFTISRQPTAGAPAEPDKNEYWERHLRIMRANAEDAKNRAKKAPPKPPPMDPQKVADEARRIQNFGGVNATEAVRIVRAVENRTAANDPAIVGVLIRVHKNEQRAQGVGVSTETAVAHVNEMLRR